MLVLSIGISFFGNSLINNIDDSAKHEMKITYPKNGEGKCMVQQRMLLLMKMNRI